MNSIPRNTKAATIAWGITYSAALTADEAAYGIDAAASLIISNALTPAVAAFALGGVTNRQPNDPANYTQPNRAALTAALDAFLAVAAPLAVQIQADDGVSDEDKLAAGIQPRNFTRTPVPAPVTAPSLSLVSATSGVHQIEYADTSTPGSRKKPAGVMQIQLLLQVHAQATAADIDLAQLNTQQAISPLRITHDAGDDGKIATYWSRWVTRSGLNGPMGAPLSATISFVA
jgi:hypothetical protein